MSSHYKTFIKPDDFGPLQWQSGQLQCFFGLWVIINEIMHALFLTRQAIFSSKFNFIAEKSCFRGEFFNFFGWWMGIILGSAANESISFGIVHCLLASRYGKMKAVFYLIQAQCSHLFVIVCKYGWNKKNFQKHFPITQSQTPKKLAGEKNCPRKSVGFPWQELLNC